MSSIKNFVLGDFPVRLDGPSQVSLFAYDNHTFVVESYLDHPVAVTVSTTDGVANIKNLDSGDTIAGKPATPQRGFGGRILPTGKPHEFSDISTAAQLCRIYRSQVRGSMEDLAIAHANGSSTIGGGFLDRA